MKTTSKGHLRSQSHKGGGSRSCGLLSVVLNYFRSSNKVRAMGDSDVAALMGLAKKLVVGTSDRAFPGMQAANAWQTLGRMHQHDNKSLLKHH